MQVRRYQIIPLESIVRGYITGSAWKEYTTHGTVHGIPMPAGLREGEKLQKPIWTPSTKAEVGQKDENISPEKGAPAQVPSRLLTPSGSTRDAKTDKLPYAFQPRRW